jgi:hypothetical protein
MAVLHPSGLSFGFSLISHLNTPAVLFMFYWHKSWILGVAAPGIVLSSS